MIRSKKRILSIVIFLTLLMAGYIISSNLYTPKVQAQDVEPIHQVCLQCGCLAGNGDMHYGPEICAEPNAGFPDNFTGVQTTQTGGETSGCFCRTRLDWQD